MILILHQHDWKNLPLAQARCWRETSVAFDMHIIVGIVGVEGNCGANNLLAKAEVILKLVCNPISRLYNIILASAL